MKLAKYLVVGVLLLVGSTAQLLHAQTLVGLASGSSALWTEAGQGAANAGTAAQVNCSWTNTTSGVTFVTDARAGIPAAAQNENGNTWIVWTPGGGGCTAPDGTVTIYAYVNLDSTLGNRCLLAQPQCTFHVTAAALTAGANKLPGDVDTPLPSAIITAVNGASVNIAGTDILPTDAKMATFEALAPCAQLNSGTQFWGWGYGPAVYTGVGTAILSSYSSKSFHVYDFSLSGGLDPLTSTLVPATTITPVGAAPELVIVNSTNSTGFGNASITNVNRATLGLIFSQIFVRTQDLLNQPFAGLGASYNGITAISREMLSGTYNVFDHSIPNGKELYRGQDTGLCSGTAFLSNPLSVTRIIADGGTSTTGTHTRAIGTGEMIQEVATVPDSIGYAFFSAGNFATSTAYTVGNIKYLTVDAVDPLQASYTTGAVPNATNGLLPNVTLQNVANGSYPIWSELRFVSYSGGVAAAQQLATWAQSQVSFGAGATQPDLITAPNLNVFHAHFSYSFATPAPGFTSPVAANGVRVCGAGAPQEEGGDAGGLVMSLQAGGDFCVLKSNYGAAGGVGPTNTASFGTRQ